MLIVPALILVSIGFLVLWRIPRCTAAAADEHGARLSIVIPARNEERNLPVLLASISRQTSRPHEIIVVDDASTDRTAAVAVEHGARVVSSQPLPEGWGGKTWACQQGADAASGDLLLFLDADTWLEPRGLQRILGTWETTGGALSVMPWHSMHRPHEQFSAFFNLLMAAGLGAFTLLGTRLRPAGLFGQMLLVPRQDYFTAGGHAAVRDRNLENSWLGRRLQESGTALHCRSGQGVLSFRMYPQSLAELIRGWAKGFAAGAGVTPPLLMLLIVAWLTGLMMVAGNTLAAALAADTDAAARWGLLYLGSAVQLHWQFRRIGAFRWSTALLYPVYLVFYFAVFALSACRHRIGSAAVWKGRPFHAR